MKSPLSRFRLDNRLRLGFAAGLFLLLLSLLITSYTKRELVSQRNRVAATNDMILQLQEIQSTVKDGETGFRGYCVMRDSVFLQIYFSSRKEVVSLLKQLAQMSPQNPATQKNLDSLNYLIRRKYGIMEWGISEFNLNGFRLSDDMKREAYLGKQVMDSLRVLVNKMEHNETNLLRARDEQLTSQFRALDIVTAASLILAVLLFSSSFFIYVQENRARRDSEQKLAIYQQELKQRIEQLGSANRELVQMRSLEKFAATGRIARTIAHEIRNPLTNINLGIDQIRNSVNASDETTMLTDLVLRNSSRINQLLTDLLQSTKISELNYSKISINKLLDQALLQASDRIALKGVRVVKNYDADLCDVNADAEKLCIAFLNIIVNAIESTEPNTGIITLRTRQTDGKCIVEISDNGSGMPKESLSKLFEPYFTTKPKGSGLGLANTQNIILNHKGTIFAESELGRGSAFTITLNID
jgi:signal transduction histidine kinase